MKIAVNEPLTEPYAVTQSDMTPAPRSVRPSRKYLPQLVASAAATSPESPALRMGSESLTYAELNSRAEHLAGYLASLGVRSEVPVGICLERSFDYIIAALAVWKAGGAYLPLDPAWPEDRRSFVLEDAQASVLITRDAMAKGNCVVVPGRDQDKIARAAPLAEKDIAPECLAYIIYTSGSAGRPKGVEVTHGNLLNLVSWHRRTFRVTAQDRASHIAGLAFDAAVWEIWPYLSAGASVVLADETTRASSDLLREWLAAERITISFVPTTLAEPMIQSPWPVTYQAPVSAHGGRHAASISIFRSAIPVRE